MIAFSSAGSIEMERHADSKASSSVPVATITPPSDTIQKWSATPRASILRAWWIAMGAGSPVSAAGTRSTIRSRDCVMMMLLHICIDGCGAPMMTRRDDDCSE